jgi:hypothetical protein
MLDQNTAQSINLNGIDEEEEQEEEVEEGDISCTVQEFSAICDDRLCHCFGFSLLRDVDICIVRYIFTCNSIRVLVCVDTRLEKHCGK